MTRTVIARDVHCVFPGCRKLARHTDLDHITAYRKGDRTTRTNLMSLCRRHHRLKHTGRWTVHRDEQTGITTWTHRRNGRQYRSRPPTQPTTISPIPAEADQATPAILTTPPMSKDDPPPF